MTNIAIMVPKQDYPEFRLVLTWRSDADGNGTHVYLSTDARIDGNMTGQTVDLQSSFHPTTNLLEAVESALTNFFGE